MHMNARSEAECYTRYRATARRFELFGAAILAAGVLCYTAFGDSVKWPGVALGAASLRPHNVVKSFALQCMQNPNEEYARGLLNALTAERRIRLTMRSIRMVEGAVITYARTENVNKELAERLAAALHEHVVKKTF